MDNSIHQYCNIILALYFTIYSLIELYANPVLCLLVYISAP